MSRIKNKKTAFQARNDWARIRVHVRREVSRVMVDLERGEVDALDLEKLHNFCMHSLALMSKVDQNTWERAKAQAEIGDFLHKEAFTEPA